MALDRKLVTSVLIKMGVEAKIAKNLSSDRAEKKLAHRLSQGQRPADPTLEEAVLCADLGFPITVAAEGSSAALGTTKTPTQAPAAAQNDHPTPTPAKAKTTKAPSANKAGAKPRAEGGIAAFKNQFKTRKTYDREELVKAVVAEGKCSHNSVNNYISLAKKSNKTFGFQLVEKKLADGKKILIKVD
jgi:hypothetical protein